LKNTEFATFIRKRGNEYIAFVPKLSIIKTNSSLEDLYEDTQSEIVKKSPNPTESSLDTSFFKKLILVFTVSTLLMLTFVASINVGLKQIANHKYLRFERKLGESLNPTVEKQQERLERFEKKLEKSQPYIKAIKNFFEE